jgi:hypothetical protein
MLDRNNLTEFRKNISALDNRAIFEIPEILANLLEKAAVNAGESRNFATSPTAIK